MCAMSVIGAGNMGTAIGSLAVKAGVAVQILAPTLEEAEQTASKIGAVAGTVGDPLTGTIVVLAVPYRAIDGLLATYGDELFGKIVVDITNPIAAATADGLVVPADASAAAQIAQAVPGARVLKAFNTTFAGTLNAGQVGGQTTTVLVAGDDADAKAALMKVVSDAGLAAIDVGSLKRARELEAIGYLEIALAMSGAIPWSGGFAVVT